MQLQFHGAAETVSGSCFLISFDSHKVLVDCGMFHGPQEMRQRNYDDFPFSPSEIDAVILTHAHIDHSGLLPKLVKHGFKGPIHATAATADLCSIMLPDSAYIQESEVERKNRKLRRQGKKLLTPIYTKKHADETLQLFQREIYDEKIEVMPGLSLRMRDAGHILGSAIVELWVQEDDETTKLVFSGDIGNEGQPIVQDPTYISDADYIIVESTYGTRQHEDRSQRSERLAEVVNDTIESGGNLLIPAFALGRTQDILYELKQLMLAGEIPRLEVYVDSPLATSATEIFQKHPQFFDWETRAMLAEGRSPFDFDGLHYTQNVEDSMRLNKIAGGVVIISASGMADAGRIKHHLKHNLWRDKAGVLFIGYQATGTLGRRLQDGAEQVRIHGDQIQVNAQIHTITGFSAHGDQGALMKWLESFQNVKRIFVTHGETDTAQEFAEHIRTNIGKLAVVPKLDEAYELGPDHFHRIGASSFAEVTIPADFSGVVRITEEEKTVFTGSYGLANRRDNISNNRTTKFAIASGSKLFTAVSIGQLVAQGELAWDTKLTDCLPNVFPKWDEEITIHHLLTHTSGIPDYFAESESDDFASIWNELPMYQVRSPQDYLPLFQEMPMDGKPGEAFKYNNAGYIVLGLIVEKITERSFGEYVQDNIFTPLNMDDTGYFYSDQLPPHTATGYIKTAEGKWQDNIYALPIVGGPDGGAYTTVADLSVFWKSFFAGELVTKEILEQMLTKHTPTDEGGFYGYGVWISDKAGAACYTIQGEDPGVAMISSVIPEKGHEITILSNGQQGTWELYAYLHAKLS